MSDTPEHRGRVPMIVGGLIAAAAGVYLALVGAGVLPLPSQPNAPGWIVVCVGVVFLLGGLAVFAQNAGGANDAGELPPDAPRWTRVVQQLTVPAIFGCFAVIGTWVAFFGDAAHFSTSAPFSAKEGGGEMVTRSAFGIGAVITWLAFFAFARRSLRQLLGHDRSDHESPVA